LRSNYNFHVLSTDTWAQLKNIAPVVMLSLLGLALSAKVN